MAAPGLDGVDNIFDDGDTGANDDWTDAFAQELGLVNEDDEEPAITQLKLFYPDFKPHTILKMNKLFGPRPIESQLPGPPRVLRPCVPQRMRLDPETDQVANFVTDSPKLPPIPLVGQSVIELPSDQVSHPLAPVSSRTELRHQLGSNGILATQAVAQKINANKGHAQASSISLLNKPDSSFELSVQGLDDPEMATSSGVMSDAELALASADWDKVIDLTPASQRDNAKLSLQDVDQSMSESIESGDGDTDDSDVLSRSQPKTPPDVSSRSSDGQSVSKRPRLGFEFTLLDNDMYNSDDENAILEGSYQLARPRPLIDMNDPHLLFVEDRSPASRLRNFEPRYNISNDRAYDMLKENYQKKVRSTIGSLNIDHSMVAQRLQSPFYKVSLTKGQLRAWHRPKFVVKPGTVIQITPIKARKKRKDKSKTIQQLLAKSSDLSLGDSASIFLIEYSEETPLVLNDFGMGSKLINYYRKKSTEDTSRPKLPLGETHVLDVQDRSAFWNFGFVEPGNVVPTLYNQMVRAPVYKHDSRSTDFLLIRSTTKARGQRYFLRPVPYLFVAGQTFPVTLIPGPHSRKVTAASKNRLKMIVFRVLNKDPHHRLQVRDISPHFPDQNDMQNRQRLKEFMEYQRSGEDQGYWKVKHGEQLPNEEVIRQMITPEDVALLEAMQQGQQHLEDSGYAKTVDQGEKQQDEDGQTIEEQLAPWNISRNFVNAVQGKAMLQLHGEGDPTGRGEGFSFLRTSMKGGFKAGGANSELDEKLKLGGHSYNVALQQKAYDEEIKRIWYTQARSLKITDPRKLPAQKPNGLSQEEERDRKVLKINRVVRDANGIIQRRTEIVTDIGVIQAYMKRKQQMEEEKMAVDDIAVTDDAEANKQRRRFLEAELARLNRNLDRRQARKATKESDSAKSKATTRKCATCGAVGHIKTNKSCPMYNDIYLGGQPQKAQNST